MAITAFKVVGVTGEKKKSNISTYSLCDLHGTLYGKKNVFPPNMLYSHAYL